MREYGCNIIQQISRFSFQSEHGERLDLGT